jgi:EAL domain-containing protein (putative c-di-GMP-specific phosphodiesterase class I)
VRSTITAIIQIGPQDLMKLSESGTPLQSSSMRYDDLTLPSAFQPIFSLRHHSSIGYEALLWAKDSAGNEVPPLDVLGRPLAQGRWNELERSVQFLHASNFAQVCIADDRLFLNIRPDGFIVPAAYRRVVEATLTSLELTPHRIVLEVLESRNGKLQQLVEGIAGFRQQGFLIALDDFGVSHSNIDRVWQLQPDIVKLDHSVVEQAALDSRRARLTRN